MTLTHDSLDVREGGANEHPLHDSGRTWPESNCYVDLWIEVLHAQRLEIEPCLSFTLASDFEGDQWTFYKPPFWDLERLYGIRVEELTLWRSILDHAVEQTGRGRLVLLEADAFHLPDTKGLDYQKSHTKTTVAITEVDPAARRSSYIHNRGQFTIEGKDFDGLFRIAPTLEPAALLPYCEIAKLDRMQHRPHGELVELAADLARGHLARRPESNPIEAYGRCIDQHLEEVLAEGGDAYDRYAFAAIRQCGSCYAFTADALRWLAAAGLETGQAADAFERISSRASMLVMKMARIAHSGRKRDLAPDFREMAQDWDTGMESLARGALR